MAITLRPETAELVRKKVAQGAYDSPDVLIEGAVQRLLAEEDEDAAFRDEIRERTRAADAEIDRGEYLELDEDNAPKTRRGG